MEVIKDPAGVAEWSAAQRRRGDGVGFVPTMGALHHGHMALIRQARNEGGQVACSIFVNPLQFNDPRDLAAYPRQLDRDLELLSDAHCDMLFSPDPEHLFRDFKPHHFDLCGLDQWWDGPSRPGHFQGVVNVVERLFFYVRPDRAYFGEKDRQQLAIVRRVARDQRWPEAIVGCPTVRESDGLAMSSRNQRLSAEQRLAATVLHRSLEAAQARAFRGNLGETINAGLAELGREPQARVDYFGVADPLTLAPLASWEGHDEAIAFVAAHVGPVRLIDNMLLRR